MRLLSLFRSPFVGSPKPHSDSPQKRRNAFRPALKRLEDRAVPTASLRVSDLRVGEGDNGLTAAIFTVAGDVSDGDWVTGNFRTIGWSAMEDVDYLPVNGTFDLTGGYSEFTVEVPIVGDTFNELDEEFALAVEYTYQYGEGQYDIGPFTDSANGWCTIVDDDGPDVSIDSISLVEGDSGTVNAVFTVSLSQAGDLPVAVDFATGDENATAGSDYTAVSGTLTFAPGEIGKAITVAVNGDQLSEPDEYFHVRLTNPVNSLMANDYGSCLIFDDDTPTITISDATVTEGNVGTQQAVFTVSLSFPSKGVTAVDFATANGTALAGSDYQATSGTLTFAAGECTKTITVPVKGDRIGEPNETFFVNLCSPTNARLGDSQAQGTIVDDEPRISISDVSRSEGRQGQATQFTFTITLSAAYDQAVTMSYRTVDGTAKAGSDYVAKTGIITFNPGETSKTVTISVIGDNKKEGNEAFSLELFGASSNAIFLDAIGLGTILNDD